MTIEERHRIVAIAVVLCALLSAVIALILPNFMMGLSGYLHPSAISIPVVFGFLSSTSLIIWSIFYVAEPLRFIATGRFALISIGTLTAAGQTFASFSSLSASLAVTDTSIDATAFASPAIVQPTHDFWPATLTMLTVMTVAVVLTWLYVLVARDQRDNGSYFQT